MPSVTTNELFRTINVHDLAVFARVVRFVSCSMFHVRPVPSPSAKTIKMLETGCGIIQLMLE